MQHAARITRRLASLTAALVVAHASLATAQDAPRPTPGGNDEAAVVDIVKASEAITVDGKLDEPTWQNATVIDVNFKGSTKGVRDEVTPMKVRYAWDEHYLYIGYELLDTDLRAITDGRLEGPVNNQRTTAIPWDPARETDCMEVFVSFGSNRFMWEIQHNSQNHLNTVLDVIIDQDDAAWGSVQNAGGIFMLDREYVQDDGDYTVKSAVTLMPAAGGSASTPNHGDDTDKGYTGEIRLPWFGLGAPLKNRTKTPGTWSMAGMQVQLFAATLNGNDGKPVYHHSSPTRANDGMFASAFLTFPKYRLVEAQTTE